MKFTSTQQSSLQRKLWLHTKHSKLLPLGTLRSVNALSPFPLPSVTLRSINDLVPLSLYLLSHWIARCNAHSPISSVTMSSVNYSPSLPSAVLWPPPPLPVFSVTWNNVNIMSSSPLPSVFCHIVQNYWPRLPHPLFSVTMLDVSCNDPLPLSLYPLSHCAVLMTPYPSPSVLSHIAQWPPPLPTV